MPHTFEAGMRVQAKSGRSPPGLDGDEWVVARVKDYRDCCDCGGMPLGGHWGSCVSRTWNLEAGHYQRLTIEDKDGTKHHLSASWFVPA